MADESGVRTVHAATTSTTAESVGLTGTVSEVRVTNRDTTNTMYCTVSTGQSAAAAEAGLVTAVAAADETFSLPPSTTKTVFKSGRPTYVALSVIGNASDYSVEGSEYGFSD